jgi:hypothetical protein
MASLTEIEGGPEKQISLKLQIQSAFSSRKRAQMQRNAMRRLSLDSIRIKYVTIIVNIPGKVLIKHTNKKSDASMLSGVKTLFEVVWTYRINVGSEWSRDK